MRRYLTTAIDYPNAPPHLGHVLEKVLADVLARWWRLTGDTVRFQVGTDEHGVKIQRTADREGVSPRELVDRNVPLFRDLYERLQISYDVFMRTTDQKEHWPTVRELWKRLEKRGVIEKRAYKGLYCSGCEKFITRKDVVDGRCPDHQTVPEEISEENWFFLLKGEGEWLCDLLMRKDGYCIVPESRSHDVLALLEQGLEDVSFSRPTSSLSWGIPVPDDPDQIMYVWCDALTNYISGLGYFTDHEEKEWWEGADVTHVIGKDIARFHALIWPAMLRSAGLKVPPPHRLIIHGFITSDGQKMSKSIGNVVDPVEVMEKYGVDALRFYLMYEIPVGNDGDFSWKRFGEMYQSKLGNQLGNLLNRVLLLLKREGGALIASSGDVSESWQNFTEHMELFACSEAIAVPMHMIASLNKVVDEGKPWALVGKKKGQFLSGITESLRHISLMLLPCIPETAQKISMQLGVPYSDAMLGKDFVITGEMKRWGGCRDWKRVGEPKILFPKVD